jgi:CubicO group peptidase (beta-lactamase class C family)
MKNLFHLFLIHLIFTCLSNQVYSQNPQMEFDKILNEQNFDNSPGYAVLVAKNGEVIYREAFGYANLEQDVKLKPEHIFRIGSITKQFTASAILKLEEEGKLSLQDEVTKFIADYPTHGHTITIEHLLTHTSGIKSYTSMMSWDAEVRKKDFTPMQLIDYFKKEPMDFAPGEKFLYNNSAYIILGYIIEKASGKTYEEYLKEAFFTPLGMENTSYDKTSLILKNRACGYQKEGNEFENADFLSMTQPYAAGSLLSTVDDLFKWYSAVMNDKVISKENRMKAHSSYILNNEKPTGYGYGWSMGNIQGSQMIEHGGGINGFLSASLWLPEEKVFVAVFSNCTGNPPESTAFNLAAAAIGKPFNRQEIKTEKEKLEEYVGVYESADKEIRTLVIDKDSLYYVYPAGNRLKLLPSGEDRFFIKDRFSEYAFNRNQQGKVVSLTAKGTGYLPLELNKTDKQIDVKKEVELPDELLDKYLGKYQLMPEFILTITREGKRVFVQATGQMRGEIFASEPHRFFSKDVNAEFIFHVDMFDVVTELTLVQNGEHKAKKIE